ncbi:MAG: SPOR domain-containing protein [Thermodesulfobacteriota bacterium]|nr:SPOR domain-containing protein [Thermodesulfobacteriota bacterium]
MKKKKKENPAQQSVAKNIFWVIASFCILTGTGMLLHYTTNNAGFSFNPVGYLMDSMAPDTGHVNTSIKKSVPGKNTGALEYSFYSLLDGSGSKTDQPYGIQIAAFKSKERADTFTQGLKRDHHLRCKITKNKKWYLVRWGCFPTKAAAQRYCKKISAKLAMKCITVEIQD